MPIILITLIYPLLNLHHAWAVLSFLQLFLLLSFSFLWDISFILRIKYKITWNKNTAIHSTFTNIQSSDLWKPEIFYLFISPSHCRPDQVVGTGTLPSSFPANPLNSPFIFSTCRKSPLFFRAAAMSYHCQSSHYISAFLSNFSFNLSASLSIPHFSLASLLNDPFDHFHFLCPDALLQLSDLPKCSSFTFHTFIKLLSPFLSEFSLAVLSSF